MIGTTVVVVAVEMFGKEVNVDNFKNYKLIRARMIWVN